MYKEELIRYQAVVNILCDSYLLPCIKVRWNLYLNDEYPGLTCARVYFHPLDISTSVIELNPTVYELYGFDFLEKFLLHEVAHYIIMSRGETVHLHGKKFLDLCDKLGGAVGYFQIPKHLMSRYKHLICARLNSPR